MVRGLLGGVLVEMRVGYAVSVGMGGGKVEEKYEQVSISGVWNCR